ncbi:MAG: glycoside hydrolase family 3 N-terminal domain-containing protein [Syntrophobacteraceae bacterium]
MHRSESKKCSASPGIHLLVGFNGTKFEEELKHILSEFQVGGIVLFRKNIESPDQLRTLIEKAREFAANTLGRPIQIAIDQEGGPVQRLGPPFIQLPSARELSAEGPKAVVKWTTRSALELHSLGIRINLAPVLDVAPEGKPLFMEVRSLGSDPERVAELGRLWIKTLQENGVSATAKHYPGLGQAKLDPHHYAPVIRWKDAAAMNKDLAPFREAIKGGVHCIMTSHALYPLLDPKWPATLSPVINHEWLRNRLGFNGVLLSDDLDMAAVSEKYSWDEIVKQGLLSSIDFFLLCQRSENIEPFYRALRNSLESDLALADAAQKSLRRIERFFHLSQIPPAKPEACKTMDRSNRLEL